MPIEIYNLIVGIATVLLAFLVVCLILFRVVAGSQSNLLQMIRRYALPIGFFIAVGATAGSLIYSNAYHLTPCMYCWLQRIFIYPQVVLFGMAWYRSVKKGSSATEIFYHSIPLAVVGLCLSIYHVLLQESVIASKGACVQNGVSCTTIDISIFGFLTIPMMGILIGVSFTLLGILVLTSKSDTEGFINTIISKIKNTF